MRLFLLGQLISQVGSWLQLMAQNLLVLHLTGSGVALGIVSACQFLPTLVFGAWGGVICDRVDKRRIMYVTQPVMALTSGVLGVLVLFDRATVGFVYVLAALTGVVKAFDDPPRRTFVAELVDDDLLPSAVGLNSAVLNGARVVGPAIGGVLIATVGLGWCFIANSMSFVVAIVSMVVMDTSSIRLSARLASAKGQIREAVRYVRHDGQLLWGMVLLAAIATLGLNWHILLPLVAERVLDGDDVTYALLTVSTGVGSIAGSLLIARQTTLDLNLLARSAVLSGVALLALAGSGSLAMALITTLAWGAAAFVFIAGTQTMMQLACVPNMRGRVMALFGVVLLGGVPIGGLLSGWLAEQHGTRTAIAACGVASAACGMATLVLGRRRVTLGRSELA